MPYVVLGSPHCVTQAGVLSELRGSVLVGAQYLMDCHQGPGQFVAQVRAGDGAADPRAGAIARCYQHSHSVCSLPCSTLLRP